MTAELDSRLPLASGTLTVRQVLDTLVLYPGSTVRYYDCAGTPARSAAPPTGSRWETLAASP